MSENNIFTRIKNSFFLAWKGRENLRTALWFWGGISYATAFIAIKFIELIHIKFISIVIALLFIIYYVWHIIIIRRCAPKKPKLSAEEEAKIKEERRKELLTRFFRKLMLKEPISKLNPVTIVTVMDLYAMAVFSQYIL